MSKQQITLAIVMIGLFLAAIVLQWKLPLALSVVFTPAIVVAIVEIVRRKRCLKDWYRHRPVHYRAWLARYGNERKEEIKRFLRIYADAFVIDKDIIHKIGPDDGIMDYYHRDHESGEADAMEDVAFVKALKEEFDYQVKFPDGKLTLGALFEKATKRA